MQRRGVMPVLEIVQRGHPILEKRAHRISDVKNPAITSQIADMKETYENIQGLGIAAPQVGIDSRMFYMSSMPCPLYPDAPVYPATLIINPVILGKSKKLMTNWESCLSISGYYGLVPRHEWVRVEYTTAEGDRVKKFFEGFLARIFQHEYDHINGILFPARIPSGQIYTRREFKKIVARAEPKVHA